MDERTEVERDRHLPLTASFTFITLMPTISACQACLLGRSWVTEGEGVVVSGPSTMEC